LWFFKNWIGNKEGAEDGPIISIVEKLLHLVIEGLTPYRKHKQVRPPCLVLVNFQDVGNVH